jgi:uncharacterized membrane protein YoaK (UPF0700 family)
VAAEPAQSLTHPLTRTLLVLTFVAGVVDAISFLALGLVFSANMNGNILLLGFGVAGKGGLPVIAPLVAFAAFLAGAFAGGRLARRFASETHRELFVAILLEGALILSCAVVALLVDVRPREFAAGLVIALLAIAMGMRTATVRRIGVPDLNTTLVTLTVVGLGADIGTAAGRAVDTRRRIAAVAALFAGALAGALLLRADLALTLFVAAATSLVAGLAYLRAA